MPELEQKTFQNRYISYKVFISNILNANFVKDDISAGYIKLNEINVSRVNIIATIVYKYEDLSYASAVIDDGTGKISLRSFENKNAFSMVDIGDVILAIGKIREFNGEKYILPEILKKINNAEWINVRKLELKNMGILIEDTIQNKNNDSASDNLAGTSEEIYSLIKKLDCGEGISTDEVIKVSNNAEAESIINKLLEHGDIFEIKPGKLKVLE